MYLLQTVATARNTESPMVANTETFSNYQEMIRSAGQRLDQAGETAEFLIRDASTFRVIDQVFRRAYTVREPVMAGDRLIDPGVKLYIVRSDLAPTLMPAGRAPDRIVEVTPARFFRRGHHLVWTVPMMLLMTHEEFLASGAPPREDTPSIAEDLMMLRDELENMQDDLDGLLYVEVREIADAVQDVLDKLEHHVDGLTALIEEASDG